jgi:hypothetical protein
MDLPQNRFNLKKIIFKFKGNALTFVETAFTESEITFQSRYNTAITHAITQLFCATDYISTIVTVRFVWPSLIGFADCSGTLPQDI